MYLTFPFFGLGQGAFYRLSANPEFSGSRVLVYLGGDGVHNELFRTLVELGPIGLGLVLFIAIPFVRLGRQNFQWVSFYALAGVIVGNLYTNALLVRELLMLFAIFAGCYLWEAQSVGAVRRNLASPVTVRYAAGIFVALALAALIEVVASFGRFPFTYGQRCLEVRPLAKDGWTHGVLRVPVPLGAARADFAIVADRPDLARRPLDLDVSVLSGDGSSLATRRYTFFEPDQQARLVQLRIPESPDDKRFVELRPSHCYVPLNLGITYDPRRLGVRVKELHFTSAAGDEIR
jgi:hypothetical protein